MIQFDPKTHSFSHRGQEVPSVTRVLKDEGWINSRFFTPEARERGQFVHEATALLDADMLDWSSLDAEVRPYVQSWEKARTELGLRITGIERIVHKAALYAGIVDREAVWQKQKTLVDLKTGSPARTDKLQIVAYGATYKERPRLLLVYVKPDGYKAVELEPEVVEIYSLCWHQIVSLWHWRRRPE